MAKILFFRKILAVVISIAVVLGLVPFLSSCFSSSSLLKFGDLTVCAKIDEEGAPIDQKDEFNINAKKIFVTIEVNGVKADDNKRFTIVNMETDEIVFDITDKYSTKLEGLVEGNFYIETKDIEEGQILLEPGNYTVSFYHNGELKDSTDFKINKPESEIQEVTLSNAVDEITFEPLNDIKEFGAMDTIYVSILTNNQISGDVYSVRWYYGEDEIIDIVDLEVTENIYKEEYVIFWMPIEGSMGPGNYKAEIYLNSSLYGKYDFIIIGEVPIEEAGTGTGSYNIYFTQENLYTSQDYELSINYPDEWDFEITEDDKGYSILFFPISDETYMSVSLTISGKGNYDPDDLKAFSDEGVMDTGLETYNVEEYSGEILDSYYYEEYDYNLTDSEENEFLINNFLILRENNLVILSGISFSPQAEMYWDIYTAMLGTLSFE